MHLLSASQVTLFQECPRKWAWKHVAKIQTPQHPSAALGDEVEKEQLVPYLRDGRPFDFSRESESGYIAASALEHLPQPKTPGLEFQKKFVIPSPTWVDGKHIGFGFIGYKDFCHEDSQILPNMPAFESVIPVVGDFKITSNVKLYAKTETVLRTDVQANMYAFATMYETRVKAVDLYWVTMQTQGARRSKRAHLRVFQPDVAEQFLKINEVGKTIFNIRQQANGVDPQQYPLSLPKNLAMCEEFKGCPHKDRCCLTPAERAEAMALAYERREAWRARMAREGTEEEPVMSNVVGGPDTLSLLAALKAKQDGGVVPPAALPTPAPPPVATATTTVVIAPDLPPALPINPPESALPPAPPVGVAAQSAEEAPKRGPGRPKGAKNVAKDAPAATPEATAAPVAVPTPTPAPASPSGRPIGTLYLDCYPIDGTIPTQAERLFSTVQQRIQKSHNVPDYRLIDFKGAGVFATALGETVDQLVPGDVVLDTRTPEGAIAKSVLVFRADRVVQGIR